MKRPVVLHPEARSEIGSAALWYEDRSAGLGSDFMRLVETAFAQIERTPEQFPVVHAPIRRLLLRRFPLAIYFVEFEDVIRVLACIHVRRDPKRWLRRA